MVRIAMVSRVAMMRRGPAAVGAAIAAFSGWEPALRGACAMALGPKKREVHRAGAGRKCGVVRGWRGVARGGVVWRGVWCAVLVLGGVVCGVCCGRYVLLVPLAPLASLGLGPAQAACVWPPQAVQTPFRWLWGVCYGTGGGAEQNCTI